MVNEHLKFEQGVREQMRHFASNVLKRYGAEADRLADVPSALLQMPEVLDLMRGFVPLEFGGGWKASSREVGCFDMAGSALLRTVASEEAAAVAPGLYLALPGPSLAEAIVTAYGTHDQKRLFFASFSDSVPCWAAFAMSDPGAGSDLASISTTAMHENGFFRLNGCKWFVGNAARAEWFVVFATGKPGGGLFSLRAFLIRRGTPGLAVDELLPTLGLRALQTAQVTLRDCCIPSDCELRPEGIRQASTFLGGMRTFQSFRPTVAAFAIGASWAAIALAREFVEQNGAFHAEARCWGRVRAVLDDLTIRVHAGRQLYRRAAILFDAGVDNTKEASLAKAFAARLAVDAVDECMRIIGPQAVIVGSPLEVLFRDALAFDIMEGTGDVMRLNISRAALAARSRADREIPN